MSKKKDRAVAKKPAPTATAERRNYFKQSDFPQTSLQQAQKTASALVDHFAGVDGSPPDIALSIGVVPTSNLWPALAGSSIAYGLTDGGVNASVIKLLPLGRQLVAPAEEEPGADLAARREAVLRPRICKEFFERYRRAKFPADTIAGTVLKGLGLPPDRVQSAVEIPKENGRYAGFIRDTPTGPFINLDSPGVPAPAATPALRSEEAEGESSEEVEESSPQGAAADAPAPPLIIKPPASASVDPKANRVFISHGKQKSIVAQIKDLLVYGNFEAVVSVERESTAIPVPEKVFEDMRSCGAGVIHIAAEGKYSDREGNEHNKINDNVLIEIGAAMALYGKKTVLLVERGLALPSNLQGLYRCEFEGDQLDHAATMKLLKTFSQFR